MNGWGFSFGILNVMICPVCGFKNPKDAQFCHRQRPSKCLVNMYAPGMTRSRRPLTDYEKVKLSWYRDEKKWIDNIKSRKTIYQNGKPLTVLTDSRGNIKGELPAQPRKYWKEPEVRKVR